MVSRFDCPSGGLGLGGLLRRTRGFLWASLALALAAHAALSRLSVLGAEEQAAKPLTTQFVKRQPRLTKPLEMKKRPQPKKRQLRRQMVAVAAQTRRAEAAGGIGGFALAGRLARPSVEVWRSARFQATDMEPEALAQAVEGEKEAKHIVDMSLEMMDVGSLDTGRYHALVIQDATDKRNIKGFFLLKYAFSISQSEGVLAGQDWRLVHAINSMVEAMNQYTNIDTRYAGKIPFTAPEMAKIPWVLCVISQPFAFSEEEAACLGRYLVSGGFLLCDAVEPVEFYRGHRQKRIPVALTCSRNNFRMTMATQNLLEGRDWAFEFLPHDHPLFHCYFDFDGSPASWYDVEMPLSGEIEGVTVGGRLLIATCQKALVHIWGDPLNPDMREERMVQFGINTIVFALTQEGSITHQVVDQVR